MRVLMISRDDVHSVMGGDTIQMLRTRDELEKMGVEVELATLSQSVELRQFDLVHVFNWELLIPVLKAHLHSFRNGPPLVLSPIFWFHTGHWYDQAAESKRIWRLAAAGLGASHSRRLYEDWQQFKFRWGRQASELRQAFAIPARLLPNSRIELEHLRAVLGLGRDVYARAVIVPNAVVKDWFEPPPLPNDEFRREYGLDGFILEVARIQSAKNQLGLIEALKDTSFPLVLIGQPSPYEEDYVARCYQQAERRGNVYFIGPKSPQELAGIYAMAAVHVLPSWRETPGLASLEAAAAGCRIVSTSIGSAREYFREDAWYCDPRQPQSIRQAVLSALQYPPNDRLRTRILQEFTWEVAARKTLEAYQQALSSHSNH